MLVNQPTYTPYLHHRPSQQQGPDGGRGGEPEGGGGEQVKTRKRTLQPLTSKIPRRELPMEEVDEEEGQKEENENR